jgi:hypothetical protein
MSARDGLGRTSPAAARLSIARLTPPADFPEGGHPYRDRCPVSDFFTQGQKIAAMTPSAPARASYRCVFDD